MARRNQGKEKLLSPQQLKFVSVWAGDDREAARLAGYSHPDVAAPKLMKIPAVVAAVLQKQRDILEGTAKNLGKQLRNVDEALLVDRLLNLSETSPEVTGGITGQVKALEVLAKIKGYIVNRHEDLTQRLVGKNKEELRFIAVYGREPSNAEELQRFVLSSSGNPAETN